VDGESWLRKGDRKGTVSWRQSWRHYCTLCLCYTMQGVIVCGETFHLQAIFSLANGSIKYLATSHSRLDVYKHIHRSTKETNYNCSSLSMPHSLPNIVSLNSWQVGPTKEQLFATLNAPPTKAPCQDRGELAATRSHTNTYTRHICTVPMTMQEYRAGNSVP